MSRSPSLLQNWLSVVRTCNLPKGSRMDPVSKWLIITRSCVFPMTILSGLIGIALARIDGMWSLERALLVILGLILAHGANNMVNDLLDERGGVDTKDYPRAAYWYRKVVVAGKRAHASQVTNLAECYYEMGSPSMAAALLKRYSFDKNATSASVKLWGRLKRRDLAVSTAQSASGRNVGMILLAAGDACREAGDLSQARGFYEQAADKLSKRWKDIALAAAESMKLTEGLDTAALQDGHCGL